MPLHQTYISSQQYGEVPTQARLFWKGIKIPDSWEGPRPAPGQELSPEMMTFAMQRINEIQEEKEIRQKLYEVARRKVEIMIGEALPSSDEDIANLERERLTQERLAQERLTQERLTQERLAQERLTQKILAEHRLTQERLAQERSTQKILAQHRLAQQRLSQERLAQEKTLPQHEIVSQNRFVSHESSLKQVVTSDSFTDTFHSTVVEELESLGSEKSESTLQPESSRTSSADEITTRECPTQTLTNVILKDQATYSSPSITLASTQTFNEGHDKEISTDAIVDPPKPVMFDGSVQTDDVIFNEFIELTKPALLENKCTQKGNLGGIYSDESSATNSSNEQNSAALSSINMYSDVSYKMSQRSRSIKDASHSYVYDHHNTRRDDRRLRTSRHASQIDDQYELDVDQDNVYSNSEQILTRRRDDRDNRNIPPISYTYNRMLNKEMPPQRKSAVRKSAIVMREQKSPMRSVASTKSPKNRTRRSSRRIIENTIPQDRVSSIPRAARDISTVKAGRTRTKTPTRAVESAQSRNYSDTAIIKQNLRNIYSPRRGVSSRSQSKTRSKTPSQVQFSPKRAQLTPRRSEITPRRSQITPRKSNVTPTRSQITPKHSQITPKRSQITPKRSQITPKRSQIRPKRSQNVMTRGKGDDFNERYHRQGVKSYIPKSKPAAAVESLGRRRR